MKGVVWRGWMTSLLYLFRIVWRRGAGYSWRTQDGDGRQGCKVPGRLAGRTWLFSSYHKLLPLPGGCFVLWCACYLPLVLVLLCLEVVAVLFFFICFRSFQVSATSVTAVFFVVFVYFVFSFDESVSPFVFIYFIEYVCRSCRIQDDDMALHCLLFLPQNNAVSLRRSFVTT